MAAYPELSLVALPAERVADPLATLKFTTTPACGTPWFSTRTVSGAFSVAPWPIHLAGATAPRSSAVAVPTTVACLDCGEE
jgi:hypothetical protein